MRALEFTEMSTFITVNGDPDKDVEETWFMEGLAMLVKGGNCFVAAGIGNAEDAVVSGIFNDPDDGSAYVALKTLHEITVGGYPHATGFDTWDEFVLDFNGDDFDGY